MSMTKFFRDILKVNGKYDPKRVLLLTFAVVVIASWMAQQFFRLDVPEFMFRLLVDILKSVLPNTP